MRLPACALFVASSLLAGDITPTRSVKTPLGDGPVIRTHRRQLLQDGLYFGQMDKRGEMTLTKVGLDGQVSRQRVSREFRLDEYGAVIAPGNQNACSTVGVDAAINSRGELVLNGSVVRSGLHWSADLVCGFGQAVAWNPEGAALLLTSAGARELALGGAELDAARKHYAGRKASSDDEVFMYIATISVASPRDVYVFYSGGGASIPVVRFRDGKADQRLSLRLPDGKRHMAVGAVAGGFALLDRTSHMHIFEWVAP